jgi:hypothetical protein
MLNLDEYVVDVLMRDLVGHDRRPAAFLVYLWLTSEQARRRGAVQVSYQELAESVGLSKSSAQGNFSHRARKMSRLSPLTLCGVRGGMQHAASVSAAVSDVLSDRAPLGKNPLDVCTAPTLRITVENRD